LEERKTCTKKKELVKYITKRIGQEKLQSKKKNTVIVCLYRLGGSSTFFFFKKKEKPALKRKTMQE